MNHKLAVRFYSILLPVLVSSRESLVSPEETRAHLSQWDPSADELSKEYFNSRIVSYGPPPDRRTKKLLSKERIRYTHQATDLPPTMGFKLGKSKGN